MATVISVENLSKLYHIGLRQHSGSLRESITNLAKNPIGWLSRNGSREELWALNNVSFDVREGELVGIIGSNGAGKSTLLKILSRITEPTSGQVKLSGRVGSLLEVGTGFHPELTGRENIFLNGAILGMKRQEIARKFDQIVAFSEIERFIDTPVKFYSSGMYVRLAFSVAAHLEPDILIVDEVLAVGDAAFQKKCLGKMDDVAGHGRTVLFVSHSMAAVRKLCSRAICLQSGEIVHDGASDDVTEKYLQESARVESFADIPTIIKSLPPDPVFRWKGIRLTQGGREVPQIVNGQPLELTVNYRVLKPTWGLRVLFDLSDIDGTLLFRSFNDEDHDDVPVVAPGDYISKAIIPANLLAPIDYELRIYATVFNIRMCPPERGISIPIKVEATGRSNRAYLGDPIRGKLTPPITWTTQTNSSQLSQF